MNEERIERALDSVTRGLADVRESVAGLNARMDTAAGLHAEVAEVRTALAKHETLDAGIQAQLSAEVRRVWWGVGVVFAGMIGAWIKVML